MRMTFKLTKHTPIMGRCNSLHLITRKRRRVSQPVGSQDPRCHRYVTVRNQERVTGPVVAKVQVTLARASSACQLHRHQ